MVCTRVQACLKFSMFSSQQTLPPPRASPFVVDVSHWNRKRARRRPAAADGLNNRRRENEPEKEKKGELGWSRLSGRFTPWVRDTSRYRRVVVDRSFDDPGRRKIQLVPGRLCERRWTAPTRADTRVNRGPRPGYRYIFNTETKRYNPRLIGKLHLDRLPSPIQIAGERYRGYHPLSFPVAKAAGPRICFRWLQCLVIRAVALFTYRIMKSIDRYYFVYLDKRYFE